MKMSPRSQRMSGIVQEVLPGILQQLFTPEDIGFLTVAAVEVSGDLGVVDIYARTIGGPKSTFEKLRKAEKRVAHLLAQKIELRRVPVVRFKSDASVTHAQHIEEQLG